MSEEHRQLKVTHPPCSLLQPASSTKSAVSPCLLQINSLLSEERDQSCSRQAAQALRHQPLYNFARPRIMKPLPFFVFLLLVAKVDRRRVIKSWLKLESHFWCLWLSLLYPSTSPSHCHLDLSPVPRRAWRGQAAESDDWWVLVGWARIKAGSGAEQEGGTALPFLPTSQPAPPLPLEQNTEHQVFLPMQVSTTLVREQILGLISIKTLIRYIIID